MTVTRPEIFALSAHIRDHVQQYRQAQQLVGWPRLLRALALMCRSNWWGTPWWPDTVTQWLTETAETIRSDAPPGWRDVERLRGALLEAHSGCRKYIRAAQWHVSASPEQPQLRPGRLAQLTGGDHCSEGQTGLPCC